MKNPQKNKYLKTVNNLIFSIMTTQDASKLLESLSTETTNKSEIKIHEKFIRILNKLNNNELKLLTLTISLFIKY